MSIKRIFFIIIYHLMLSAFDGRVTLDEDTHRYTLVRENIVLDSSVSRVINSFFEHNHFDANAVLASAPHLTRSKPADEWKREWATKAATKDQEQVRGKALHAVIERYIRKQPPLLKEDRESREFGQFLAYERDLRQKYGYVLKRAEVCVFDRDYNIGGCMDAIAVPIDARDGDWSRAIIIDWKRQARIPADSSIAGHGAPPLEHFPNVKGSYYALQLNAYAFILEKYEPNCHVVDMHVVALHPERGYYQQISVPPLRDDVWRMLEMYRARSITF